MGGQSMTTNGHTHHEPKPTQAEFDAGRALMDEFQVRLMRMSDAYEGMADCVARMKQAFRL
jgi:hypothetical protein